MRRHVAHLVIGLAALGLVGTAGACGSSSHSTQTSPTTASPTTAIVPGTTIPLTTSPSQPASTIDVRVYFLHGEKIDVAHRTVAATTLTATAAMTELLAGPSPADQAAGLTTTVPTGTRLLGINVANGVATVDLSGIFESGGGSLSMTARLAQVTFTLTQFPAINAVTFQLDGKPVTVFGGEGIILDHPATRAGFESLTPAILVEYPGRGWAVQSPVRVAGSANVFEAQFQAEISNGSGAVIASQVIHATSGTGTRGSFSTTIAFPPGASGAATLRMFDISPKDGSRIDVVTIPLQLAGS
jgi:germination protein M